MKKQRYCRSDECNNPTTTNKWGNWAQYCSKECSKLSGNKKRKAAQAKLDQSKILEKRKATNMAKYGVDNASKSDIARRKISEASKTNAKQTTEKIKASNLVKYGVDSTNSLESVKEKKRQAYLEKYGVDHPLKVESIANSVSEQNTANADERLAKARKTNLDRFGYENPSSTPEIKDKRKAVMIERYGVENPSQLDWVHEKQFVSKKKDFVFPSGRTYKVQGYEPQAIQYLLTKYDEDDLIIERKLMPPIWYEFDGKSKRYYPDIYIKSLNLFVEVKSEWTYQQGYDKNLAKAYGTLDLGYQFTFIVYNNAGTEIISEFTPTKKAR